MFNQTRENQPTPSPEPLQEPTAVPSPQPVKKVTRTNPLVFTLLLICMVALAAIATYAVMIFASGSSKQTNQQPVEQTTTQATETQSNKILTALTSVKTLLPSTKALTQSDTSYPPHRKVGTPYNFYAAGTYNSAWHVQSDSIASTTTASQVTKSVYQYFVTDQKATIDTLIGDTTFAPLEKTDTKLMAYRITTADYTCGLTETPTYSTASSAITSVVISVSCSTADEYTKNAKVQQPFYTAISTDKTYTADVTMLNTPVIKASATANYKTAQVSIGSDTSLTSGAIGLFYQTPDGVWHFFLGTQSELSCSRYSTVDLKKAYAGEECYDEAKKTSSTVTLN